MRIKVKALNTRGKFPFQPRFHGSHGAQDPWPLLELTCVNLLQRDVLLQLPPQLHLGTIFAQGAVVSQDEVSVRVVEQ